MCAYYNSVEAVMQHLWGGYFGYISYNTSINLRDLFWKVRIKLGLYGKFA